jgi:hypothetical protein
MSDAIEQLAPEIVVVLGDRFEIFAAAQACLVHNVPLAHIAGGDTTEGAIDEAMRHAITKMAHVHFATNAESRTRLRQLGEDPARIHVVGSPGSTTCAARRCSTAPRSKRRSTRGSASATCSSPSIRLRSTRMAGVGELDALLDALDALPADTTLWCSRRTPTPAAARSRRDSKRGRRRAATASASSRRSVSFAIEPHGASRRRRRQLVERAYEAPSFGVPTVDIGDRQRGRLAASSVIRTAATRDAIGAALMRALAIGRQTDVVNPYGDGDSAAAHRRPCCARCRRPATLLEEDVPRLRRRPWLSARSSSPRPASTTTARSTLRFAWSTSPPTPAPTSSSSRRFRADLLATASAAKAAYQIANTGTSESQLEMLRRLELAPRDHCRAHRALPRGGIGFLSTGLRRREPRLPGDAADARGEDPVGRPHVRPLLLQAARLRKRLIVSTGMATLGEIEGRARRHRLGV